MTTQWDVERLLDRYLADGAEQVPDRVIDAALREIDNTSQRRALRVPWRFDDMTSHLKLALAGAAVVAVLAASSVFLTDGPRTNVGGPPAATPSPTATASPTAIPSPFTGAGGSASPGRYSTEVEGYRFIYTVFGTGWRVLASDPDGFVAIGKGDEVNDPPDFAAFAVWVTPSTVAAEPCRPSSSPPIDPGPTVDDLVNALATHRGWEATQPTDVTVDGYKGKRLQLRIPEDMDRSECLNSEYKSYEGRYYQGPGQVDDLWILDLDGARHVLVKTYFPTTPTEWQSEMDQMVASMEIEPVGP